MKNFENTLGQTFDLTDKAHFYNVKSGEIYEVKVVDGLIDVNLSEPYKSPCEALNRWMFESSIQATKKIDAIIKPPIGVTPKYIVAEKRLDEINAALRKRLGILVERNHEIPVEWIEERNELVKYLKRK